MDSKFWSEALGWTSSFVLLLTIGRQIYKQWITDSSKGVSKWLYIGQLASESGFIAYSWILKNWVFVVTNTLLLAANLLGLVITLWHRRRRRHGHDGMPFANALRASGGQQL